MIDEGLDELLNGVQQGGYDALSQRSFKSTLKQKQWLAARMLLQSMEPGLGRIYYREGGAPYLREDVCISMTHSHYLVGILLNKERETGIDIQHLNTRIRGIAAKFASDRERQFCVGENEVVMLTLIWCAKEAIYKMMHISGLIFKEEIHLQPFSFSKGGMLHARVSHENDYLAVDLNFEIFEDYVLVYCANT